MLYYLFMITKDSVFDEIRVSLYIDGICSVDMDTINDRAQQKAEICSPRLFHDLALVFSDFAPAISVTFELTKDFFLPLRYAQLGNFLDKSESRIHCYNPFLIQKANASKESVEILAKVFAARKFFKICESVVFK